MTYIIFMSPFMSPFMPLFMPPFMSPFMSPFRSYVFMSSVMVLSLCQRYRLSRYDYHTMLKSEDVSICRRPHHTISLAY